MKEENEEFWWEALDDFVVDDEIVIVDINKADLVDNNSDGLIERDSVGMKDWGALEKILGEEEMKLHKLDFEDEELTFLVFLYFPFVGPQISGFPGSRSPNSQISKFPDFQTPPPPDEFSDPNLAPLPTHPGTKLDSGHGPPFV